MGQWCSKWWKERGTHKDKIEDKYNTLDEVVIALREAGLESSNLILALDFTGSNEWKGRKTFGGRCLHEGDDNPYVRTIKILGRTLERFDDDRWIPTFLFGDADTRSTHLKQLCVTREGRYEDEKRCLGFEESLEAYFWATHCLAMGKLRLSGPTSFAPAIYEAIEIVKETGMYHILVIVADGAVDLEKETTDAIVAASSFALSIICVGVGDGEWVTMKKFDDELPARRFDNFQFVELSACRSDADFAYKALTEVPDQYRYIKQHLFRKPEPRSSHHVYSSLCKPAGA